MKADREDLARAAWEALDEQGGDGLQRVEVSFEDGEVILAGEVPSEEHRQLALHILDDRLDIEAKDRLFVTPFGFERGERPNAPSVSEDERQVRRALGTDDETTEDIFESEEEGVVYSPPDRPVRGPRED